MRYNYIKIYQKQEQELKDRFQKSAEQLDAQTAESLQNSWYYQGFLTAKQKTKTLDEQKKVIFKKLQNEYKKQLLEQAAKLEKVQLAPRFISAVVSVEWERSATWGKNPRATAKITTENGTTVLTGSSVSGCGFDKLSEAIARVLNASASVLQVIFDKFEEALTTDERATLRAVLGYGSGYELPAFEGGCGVSTIRSIFEVCGFQFEEVASGSNFNVFEVRPKC